MKNWLESVYSDGTRGFVSNPNPELGDKVNVRLRVLEGAPVVDVMIRQMVNGAERYIPMDLAYTEGGLSYYEAEITINEPRVSYLFAITTKENFYFYNQEGITTYVPDYKHDFVLLSDYVQPDWVKGAVFYQIFPERFCNGDKTNDVESGEYEYQGRKPIKVDDWNSDPIPGEISAGMDFFGGDLTGIIDKIPYLKDLGISAVYLNPIFSAYSSHKYDCIDYFHVDEHFGGDEALAKLSEALHENGIKLVLDISINHTGIEHNWVHEGKPYYFRKEDGSLMGWAGFSTLPVLDYRNEELRNVIYRDENSVLKKWLKPPYNIDGWRFDVADVLARNDDVQLAAEVWREVCDSIREVKKDAIIIGEHWADCSEYLQGNLWNTPMNYFGYGRIVRQFAGLPDLFLMRTEAFNKVKYDMTAEDVVKRTDSHYSVLPQVIADCQMNLFDSHDVPRVHNHDNITFDKWKSVALSQLLWTGIPCIYYGDELAIEGYTEHDAGFRYPMPWNKENENRDKHLAVYKKIISLRRNNPAFSEGGRKVLYADGRILAVSRFMDGEKYVGIISMEENEREIELPLWIIGAKALADVTDEFGENIDAKEKDGNLVVKVPGCASYLFRV
ncbi:alpha amylase N-terminal ig-like domain-containing protein [Butyrivibrio sp. WCE2006]|uniref:alpha amylase N-terminal ig-like domain-containing protein n=1 Tax=Butyrivibrio sp. WCE2006 TaxID=1410611 RepID=UPI000679B8C6|nr:alpha amylase N-terminal ig-like domain-containing protein [Butyrivibrio sp. WCE2006]